MIEILGGPKNTTIVGLVGTAVKPSQNAFPPLLSPAASYKWRMGQGPQKPRIKKPTIVRNRRSELFEFQLFKIMMAMTLRQMLLKRNLLYIGIRIFLRMQNLHSGNNNVLFCKLQKLCLFCWFFTVSDFWVPSDTVFSSVIL